MKAFFFFLFSVVMPLHSQSRADKDKGTLSLQTSFTHEIVENPLVTDMK